MSNLKHAKILKQGVMFWNEWRKANEDIMPDLCNENLSDTDLSGADLRNTLLIGTVLCRANLNNASLDYAELTFADLRHANLKEASAAHAKMLRANLSNANLIETNMFNVDFFEANLSNADLRKADLQCVNLCRAKLIGAKLSEANLSCSVIVETNLNSADLTGCRIFGMSAWKTETDEDTKQINLIITNYDEPIIMVDNLEVAQFTYLMLNNQKIKDVINTISRKAVLILGKFGEHKKVLDSIREMCRKLGYLPIMFDFEKPNRKDTGETIITLAGLAKFVIADLTEPRSIPLELKTIVSNLPTLPVQLLLTEDQYTFSMVDHILDYGSICGISKYKDVDHLLSNFHEMVIKPIEEWRLKNMRLIEEKMKQLMK